MKKILILFLTMLKIGAFTFGGGYAMISLLENEFVSKKKWLTHEEFMDLLAIAESTPGPIAINSSTYIGYKVGGFLGSFFATLGMCIPSFTIIFVISLFFDKFLSLSIVAAAFRGIQAGVVFLILSAGVKMLKKLPKTPFNIIMLVLVFCCMTTLALLAVNLSSIFYILICAVLGLIIYCIGYLKSKQKEKKSDPNRLCIDQPATQEQNLDTDKDPNIQKDSVDNGIETPICEDTQNASTPQSTHIDPKDDEEDEV
ncbi:MAG: chromate transporter [Christensenellales bacterium]